MKTETRISDLRKYIDASAASDARFTAKNRAIAALDQPLSSATPATQAYHEAARAASASLEVLAKLPKHRRDGAAQLAESAKTYALGTLRVLGGSYSGNTSHKVSWTTEGDTSAWTSTGYGAPYSRSCKYLKTDVTHHIALDAAGVPLLMDSEALRIASAHDGLYLISLRDDGRAVWVRAKNKAVISEAGWVAFDAETSTCYHSTESRAAAECGLARKVRRVREELARARESAKTERRARLVARLCNGATATVADARTLGYCAPGIRAFQERTGIGETATLPQLVRSGDPSAIRLALHLARKIRRESVTA